MWYGIDVKPDTNGTYHLTCPDIPEMNGVADKAILANAGLRETECQDALITAMMMYITLRRRIPTPQHVSTIGHQQRVRMPLMIQLKVLIHNAMVERNLRKIDITRLLKQHNNQTLRLLDLTHNSSLESLEAALNTLGFVLNVTVSNIDSAPPHRRNLLA